ncbi:hypothetical protein [Streptomyces sp. NPDC002187]|uniref:hypothetical protein n=1 Tax=Streptomyces sp. NPDC002187 TaxID=3364637 RepID=UPI00367DD022
MTKRQSTWELHHWAAFDDGCDHELVRGVHFTSSVRSMRSASAKWAAARGLRGHVRVVRRKDDSKIVVSFSPVKPHFPAQLALFSRTAVELPKQRRTEASA